MTNVYDKGYIEAGALCLAEAFDYASCRCGIDVEVFMELFIISGCAGKFEEEDPSVVFGLSGTELVVKIVEESGLLLNFPEPLRELGETSVEYWTGYFYGYLRYYSGCSYRDIFRNVDFDELSGNVPKLLDSGEEEREKILKGLLSSKENPVRLKTIRKECGFSQRELAEKSGVNLRTLQQYEIRSKDINKAAVSTLRALAEVLGCRITDLMEN